MFFFLLRCEPREAGAPDVSPPQRPPAVSVLEKGRNKSKANSSRNTKPFERELLCKHYRRACLPVRCDFAGRSEPKPANVAASWRNQKGRDRSELSKLLKFSIPICSDCYLNTYPSITKAWRIRVKRVDLNIETTTEDFDTAEQEPSTIIILPFFITRIFSSLICTPVNGPFCMLSICCQLGSAIRRRAECSDLLNVTVPHEEFLSALRISCASCNGSRGICGGWVGGWVGWGAGRGVETIAPADAGFWLRNSR